MTFEIADDSKSGEDDWFNCRIVTYAEELVSIYICYSTGGWFSTPLSGVITSTYGK